MAFCCTESELAMKKRFEGAYVNAQTSTMKSIERQVCGCDFGGNSWTSKEQADALIKLIGIDATSSLVDLGAGTGWPGLYFAKKTGCAVTLVDLPEIGLKIAKKRAKEEGFADRVTTKIADAADLPFADASFDAISHSDLLCCLVRKRTVLEQCHRIIGEKGVMAFTVISLTPGLGKSAYVRALAYSPEFIESEFSYDALLEKTGWVVTKKHDLTNQYRDSCERQIDADRESSAELSQLLGKDEASARLDRWQEKLLAIQDGLFMRELYVCRKQCRNGVHP